MAVYVGSARIDENGRAYGGRAGDQTGREISRQKYYAHSKGWRVFRAKDRAAAVKIAEAMEAACANSNIGYDQWQRNTLYTRAQAVDFDIGRVTQACETDCSALVRVCCAWAGVTGLPSGFRTANMADNLMATGAFIELRGDKYTRRSGYLGKGDILVTRTSGHTVVVLNDGSDYEAHPADRAVPLGGRLLKIGSEGEDVAQLQRALISLGYDCGPMGDDGDFGDNTAMAVIAFQKDAGVAADGDYGPVTHAVLMAALDGNVETPPGTAQTVRISGGSCWIRRRPDIAGERMGVARNGERLPFGGEISETGWLSVVHGNETGWVSGKYGRLE